MFPTEPSKPPPIESHSPVVVPPRPRPPQPRQTISGPTGSRPILPSPISIRPTFPSPTGSRPILPSPNSIRPTCPISIRPILPSPNSIRPTLPSPTGPRPMLPSPISIRPILPSPSGPLPIPPSSIRPPPVSETKSEVVEASQKPTRPRPPKITPEMLAKYRSMIVALPSHDDSAKKNISVENKPSVPPNITSFMPQKISAEILSKYRNFGCAELDQISTESKSGPATSDPPKNESALTKKRPPPLKLSSEILSRSETDSMISSTPISGQNFGAEFTGKSTASVAVKSPEVLKNLEKLKSPHSSGQRDLNKEVNFFLISNYLRRVV